MEGKKEEEEEEEKKSNFQKHRVKLVLKKEEKTFFILFIKMTYLNTNGNYFNFAIYKNICSTSYHMD